MSPKDKIKQYWDYGWSLLPVKPEDKRPYTQNWLQYTKQKANFNMVNEWFTHLSGAGVGVVTGRVSDLVVLDVENYCETPINELLSKYPTNLISKTGSGGYHLFYRYPPNKGRVANRVGLFNGIDLRADGGFIVLPPTLHPSGNKYEWVQEGIPGLFPNELLDVQAVSSNQEMWIQEILRGVAEGGRNDACARLCGYFFKKGIAEDIVGAILNEWNEKNDPPLPQSEIQTTINSIKRNHIGKTTTFTSVQFEDDRATTTPEQQTSSFDLIKIKDYIKGYGGDGVKWAVEDWLPSESIIFLVSPPESYKTWLLLDLATSIASGCDFIGQYKVNERGAVFIIQQEDSHMGITDRISLIMQQRLGQSVQYGDLDKTETVIPVIPDLPIYVHPSRKLRFDNQKVLAELEEQIKLIRPKVVMIDPLYSTTTADNYMATTAEQMMVLKSWRDQYGCSFVIAHHSKKNIDPESTAREDSWGSQFLNAFIEGGWQIRRNQKIAENEIVVRRHSKVLGNQEPVALTFDISTKYPMKYEVSIRNYGNPTGHVTPAQNQLFELIKDSPMSQTDIANKTGKSKATISRQIKQLEVTGAIQKMPDGKYKVIEIEFNEE